MEAKIIPDGSVWTREWSPELTAALEAWEAVILTAPPAKHSTDEQRAEHIAREEQARVAFVTCLACEMLGIDAYAIPAGSRDPSKPHRATCNCDMCTAGPQQPL